MMLPLLLSILLASAAPPVETGADAGALRLRDGKPASGVRVGVMAPLDRGRGVPRGAGTLVSQGKTDASGKYRLEDVPPGPYYILAGNLDAPSYYPGVNDFAKAKLVDVRAKTLVGDVNFEVELPSTGRGGARSSAPSPSPSAPNGRGVPSPGRASSVPSLPKAVPPSDPNVIEVKGHVVLKGDSTAPPPAGIVFQLGSVSKELAVARDGTFTLSLKRGDQSIAVASLPDGYTLESLSSQPLVVTLIAESRPRFRLIGRLLDDEMEQPLAGEQVELVLPTGEVVRTAVNAQGMFTFNKLFSGKYTLRLDSPHAEMPEKKIVISDSSVSTELRARSRE
jgi:hypothetical protein